ncbi:MAG: selenocysteine-specific translation elongation factor [SAR202 cluster bacterium]|nr:selenocysteine-specific translation elongation factor [SAR202 cluster bacterium]
MFVIGTAGHVDHGKSSLVNILSGIDPDRWQEEKDRGMTIDLGFAWFKLPSGNEVSIIDVPGHEKFVNHMLAGVGGIDLALMIIAADESIMPQTLEHFHILDLLGVSKSIIVLTKTDLVDKEWLNLVEIELQEFLAGTNWKDSPIVPLSNRTKEGVNHLIHEIDKCLNIIDTPKNIGLPKIYVDRSFSVKGFGTVVTGTLINGSVKVGDDLQIMPQGTKTKIRGIQTHQSSHEEINPGTRVALNLAGIDKNAISRGDLLVKPETTENTYVVDASFVLLKEYPNELRHNLNVTFHVGSRELLAKLRLLEKSVPVPGKEHFIQFKFENPQPISKGERYVIRSNMKTIGGGIILDLNAKRHKRGDDNLIKKLASLKEGSVSAKIVNSLNEKNIMTFNALLRDLDIDFDELIEVIEALKKESKLIQLGDDYIESEFILNQYRLEKIKEIENCLILFHKEFPLRKGMSSQSLKINLGINEIIFTYLIEFMKHKNISETSGIISLIDFVPELNNAQLDFVKSMIEALNLNPFNVEHITKFDDEILNFLLVENLLVKIDDEFIVTQEFFQTILYSVSEHIQINQSITVGEFRDLFNTSRKFALLILEHLDAKQVTKRVGDVRILR